jgi:hypothetical protein
MSLRWWDYASDGESENGVGLNRLREAAICRMWKEEEKNSKEWMDSVKYDWLIV